MSIIEALKQSYPLKGVGTPEYYLRGDVGYAKSDASPTGNFLVTSAKTYIKKVCDKIETHMEWWLRTYGSPMDPKYHSELDESPFLSTDEHASIE